MRNLTLAAMLAISLTTLNNPTLATPPDSPNIVLIMIDDLGWSDLAFQGNPLVETPNLDRFASQGVIFTDAYAAAPVCSPTRAAIMTGQAPARLRITNHLPDQPRFTPDNAALQPAECLTQLDANATTLGQHLKSAGYTTGFFGKWHLAERGNTALFPDQRGFDVNLGGCSFGGPPTFFDPYRIPTLPNRRPGEYLPDRLVAESIDFIKQHQDEPFFLCLWPYTVHWPMEAPQPLLDKYASRKGPGLNDTRYGAMIEAMDLAMGRLFQTLDELELAEDTLVVFTSDNGGFDGVADNRPLRECKGYLYEGGIRVPTVVRWPKHVDSGQKCDTPIISTDWFPTLLQVAGVQLPANTPCDGTSLVDLLTDSKPLTRDAIYFHYPNYAFHRSNRLGSAVRRGDLKLIEWLDDGSLELYDLRNDISEQHNLADSRPTVAAELRQSLHQWRKDVNAAMPTPTKSNEN